MKSVEAAAAEVARFLDQRGISYMVIGGLATLVWGEPRLTQDVDVTIGLRPKAAADLVPAVQKRFQPLVRDPVAFVAETRVLPLATADGVRIDLIFGTFRTNGLPCNGPFRSSWPSIP